jgi:hypothetical protein
MWKITLKSERVPQVVRSIVPLVVLSEDGINRVIATTTGLMNRMMLLNGASQRGLNRDIYDGTMILQDLLLLIESERVNLFHTE